MPVRTRVNDRTLTVDEFRALPEEDGCRLELSRGSVVREPAPGLRHGQVAGRLYRRLWTFAEDNGLGVVFFDTAFVLSHDQGTVRVPDVAFLSLDRIPRDGLPDGFGEGAPDLAVEVVSRSNRASEMQQKALDYLAAGAHLVWIVDPEERTVTVCRSRFEIRILVAGEELDGGDVLPGLRIPLDAIFRRE